LRATRSSLPDTSPGERSIQAKAIHGSEDRAAARAKTARVVARLRVGPGVGWGWVSYRPRHAA